jgi:integrase
MSYSLEIIQDQIEKILYPEKFADYKNPPPKLMPSQLKTLREFYNQCNADGLSPKTTLNYLRHLRTLGLCVKKPFEKMTKENLVYFLNERQRPDFLKKLGVKFPLLKEKQVSARTMNEIKVVLKKFYKWLYKMDGWGVYPEVVSWIKTPRKLNISQKLPEELLTKEEIKAMANKASNPRDRALIMILYESGCRVGEILNLKMKHVAFDQYGAVIIVNGKTGMRRIRLIDSVPDLQLWVNHHPYKDNPEAPLFIDLGAYVGGRQLGYYALLHIIKVLAAKAGINKRVHPHLFRHSRLTELAKMFTEQELKILAGWVGSSYMPRIYVHLSGADVEKKLLMLNGKLTEESLEEEKRKDETLRPKKCPRCNEINPATFRFCGKCGMVLDLKSAASLEQKREDIDNIMLKLIKDPETIAFLVEKIKEMKLGKEIEKII